jgi:hypothetical protein
MFSLLEPFIYGLIPSGTVNTLDFNPVTVNSFNHSSFQLLYTVVSKFLNQPRIKCGGLPQAGYFGGNLLGHP